MFNCLVSYWTEHGIPRERAEIAARKAIERLRVNNGDETWCLLPNIDQL
jgi:hypothetical protein